MDDPRRRCANDQDCIDAENLIVDNLGTRQFVGHLTGDEGRAFCATCVRYLRYAMIGFPLDCAELTTLMVPSMAVTYRSPDLPTQPRVKLHAPLPFNAAPEAVRALIAHELTSWAESTAVEAGVSWDTYLADHSRIGARVQAACQLLDYRLDYFLGLPPVLHEVRSTGEDPRDGWDEAAQARMIRRHGKWWIRRDGTEGALALFALHRQVEQLAGRTLGGECKMACPACRRPALKREHRAGKVICRYCWRQMTDAHYEQLLDVTSDLFEVNR